LYEFGGANEFISWHHGCSRNSVQRLRFRDRHSVNPYPVVKGTINVVVANDLGIVVLTDSMLSSKVPDDHGGWKYRQLPDPGQKLFQIDDQTIVTFAGFASAPTPVPDLLSNVSAIIGRYLGFLRQTKSATVTEQLTLMQESDLVLGPNVNRDTPEVKRLLNDFKWRRIMSMNEAMNDGLPGKGKP
jgi:hypothetical protein